MVTVRVEEIKPVQGQGNLRAFATVAVDPWTVRGCRIIQQRGQRPYVALPQHRTMDGRYFPVLQTKDRNLKDQIQATVLRAWSRGYERIDKI